MRTKLEDAAIEAIDAMKDGLGDELLPALQRVIEYANGFVEMLDDGYGYEYTCPDSYYEEDMSSYDDEE